MRPAAESPGCWKGAQKAFLKMVLEPRTDCGAIPHRLRRVRPLPRRSIDGRSLLSALIKVRLVRDG